MTRSPGIDDEGRLEEGTLRRFVFQTYGRARRTQDSPIMPDVWLSYIRVAERIAHWNIKKKDNPNAKRPNDVVDLLLTPWSGERPGKLAAQLRNSLNSATEGDRKTSRIALSDSRIVVCANFKVLLCHIVPLSGWWRDLFKDDKKFTSVFNEVDQDVLFLKTPRGKNVEFARYAALVGFVACLLEADSQGEIAKFRRARQSTGPFCGCPWLRGGGECPAHSGQPSLPARDLRPRKNSSGPCRGCEIARGYAAPRRAGQRHLPDQPE